MRQRQKGMTLIGLLLTAIIAGAIVFAGLRLVPVYLEYMKVESVLNGARDEWQGQTPSSQAVRSSIQKRLDIESVSVVTIKDFKVRKAEGGYDVSIDYAHTVPYIANVSFQVNFSKSVHVGR
jgi:Tfp pilus assembly major pilin PilA